jgi:hypothetical protein
MGNEKQPLRNGTTTGVKSSANDGGFAARARTDADAAAAPRRPRYAGVTATGATVMESSVSDREKNYWVQLDDYPANVRFRPTAAGLTDPDRAEPFGHHKLIVRAEAEGELDVTRVNLAYDAQDIHDAVAGLGSSELDLLQEKVIATFKERYGDKVVPMFNLTNTQIAGFERGRWDGAGVKYRAHYSEDDAVLNEERDGTVGFYTSNLLADLEQDEAYQDVVYGRALDIIREAAGLR